MKNMQEVFFLTEANFFNMMSIARLKTNHLQAFATGVQSTSLNHAIVYQVKDDFEDALDKCCEFYLDKKVPWEIGTSEQNYHALSNILIQLKFVEIEGGVAMLLDLQNWNLSRATVSLDIREMQNSLEEWSTPVALGFESTLEKMRPYTLRHQLASENQDAIAHFSGYLEDKAVCSLTLTRCGDAVRIDDVATIPEYQHKGNATQLLLAVLAYAKKQGARYCFLEASNSGLRLYEKVGFQRLFKNHYFQLSHTI